MATINGYKPYNDQHPYNLVLEEMAKSTIKYVRERIELPPEAEKGYRFKDDGAVMARLRSWVLPQEFALAPIQYVTEALLDCAKADWWYNHEKDWGENSRDNDDCEGDL
jgi:hypothetical protein